MIGLGLFHIMVGTAMIQKCNIREWDHDNILKADLDFEGSVKAMLEIVHTISISYQLLKLSLLHPILTSPYSNPEEKKWEFCCADGRLINTGVTLLL